MNLVETYLFLFTDSFISSLALPIQSEIVFSALRIFGGYNPYIVSLIASCGITLAACLNWLLGRALRTLNKNSETKNNPSLEKFLTPLKKHGHWLGIAGFIPVAGPLLILFTGLVQISFSKIISLVFLSNLVWHILLIRAF